LGFVTTDAQYVKEIEGKPLLCAWLVGFVKRRISAVIKKKRVEVEHDSREIMINGELRDKKTTSFHGPKIIKNV